jgi:hypothetical protein
MTIGERIEFLMPSIESHDRQIGELTGQIGELKEAHQRFRRRTRVNPARRKRGHQRPH